MTGLDTNVLVRYLAQDDDAQLGVVLKLLMKKAAVFFVPDLVLVETDWVLRSLYEWTREDVCDAFSRLLTVHNLVFEDEGRLRRALRAGQKGADLSDELIVAICQERRCQRVATFDKGVLKNHPQFGVTPK